MGAELGEDNSATVKGDSGQRTGESSSPATSGAKFYLLVC